jgi:hypothetical protein
LELHPEKSKILKLEKGIGFLGFRIFYYHRLLRRKNIKKFEKRLQNMITLYKKEKISRENVIEKFEGWLAYVSHADSYKYRKKITKTFNHNFPVQPENKIGSVKKHENFSKKIDASKTEFSQEKTLLLFKKGFNVKQIAKKRNLKESTIWGHISMLIGYHRIKLNEILSNQKIKTILLNIKNSEDKLKDIKARIKNEEISYDDINCVLANLKGKHKKKSICYFINWYQRTNCFRKCYYNKAQRKKCRIKFQKLLINNVNLQLTKKGFLNFINNHANVCILPDKEKKKFISWKKFKLMKKQNKY